MSALSKENIIELLNNSEIEGKKDLVKKGIISSIIVKENTVGFVIELEKAGGLIEAEKIKESCEDLLSKKGLTKITAVITSDSNIKNPNIKIGPKEQKKNVPPPPTPSPIAGVKNVILVGSGKGGVGKSTVAVNLAVSLAEQGFKTGIVDADIYGPSVAKMLGLNTQPEVKNGQMIPPESHGIKCMSMGFIINEDAPVVWRGPMISKALYQLLRGANWGELDFLVIDMPPGTGDIHLSIAQNFNVKGAVVVTTPQDIALLDVKKCIVMLQKVNIPILGVIENMSYFIDPASKNKTRIFGEGGGKKVAENFGIKFLGEIPLEPEITKFSDAGKAFVKSENASAKVFASLAKEISENILK